MKNRIKVLLALVLAGCGSAEPASAPPPSDAGPVAADFSSDVLCPSEGVADDVEEKAVGGQPLTMWIYGNGDKGALVSAIECALARWRAATCLPLDVALAGPHFIRWGDDADLDGMAGMIFYGSNWNDKRIKLNETIQPAKFCPVLVHEMSHLMRRNGNHPGADGSMAFPVTHVLSEPVSKITAEDLTLVCAKQPCTCFNPEP